MKTTERINRELRTFDEKSSVDGVTCFKTKILRYSFSLFIISRNKEKSTKGRKSMMSNTHLSVESLYLYADHVLVMRIGCMK
jgi:hypothetical protein